jgi:hypothetical protein
VRHLGEVALDLFAIGKLMPVRIRTKRPIGDAFDPILPLSHEQKLPPDDGFRRKNGARLRDVARTGATRALQSGLAEQCVGSRDGSHGASVGGAATAQSAAATAGSRASWARVPPPGGHDNVAQSECRGTQPSISPARLLAGHEFGRVAEPARRFLDRHRNSRSRPRPS